MQSLRHRHRRRGFTLLEALLSTGLVLVIVIALTSAVSAGQMHALDAQKTITGTMVADALMSRLVEVDYADLPTWHAYQEAPGELLDADGNPLDGPYHDVGREVEIVSHFERFADLDVNVRGRIVTVRAYTGSGATLCELERFVPEPST
ncbi:MAG: hypothetical protein AB8G96_00470 [Phycisphaerales bacterium]